jgi:hypothetical protein
MAPVLRLRMGKPVCAARARAPSSVAGMRACMRHRRTRDSPEGRRCACTHEPRVTARAAHEPLGACLQTAVASRCRARTAAAARRGRPPRRSASATRSATAARRRRHRSRAPTYQVSARALRRCPTLPPPPRQPPASRQPARRTRACLEVEVAVACLIGVRAAALFARSAFLARTALRRSALVNGQAPTSGSGRANLREDAAHADLERGGRGLAGGVHQWQCQRGTLAAHHRGVVREVDLRSRA